ncbi:hypothetical protein ABVC71_00195 [Prevotella amnii]|uniref:hypothetical protein n=1 Tax=Prevotella amnii TaxID=419005 RepID=UPI00336AEA95
MLTKFILVIYTYRKAWSQFCRSFHAIKALALPDKSKRATPKAPRQCKYIKSSLGNEQWNRPKPMRVIYNTPHEAFFVALFLTCR